MIRIYIKKKKNNNGMYCTSKQNEKKSTKRETFSLIFSKNESVMFLLNRKVTKKAKIATACQLIGKMELN